MQQLDIMFEHLNSSCGQHDWIAKASLDGKAVGYVSFTEYDEIPYVQMVWVGEEYRRLGVATGLLTRLQGRYPGVTIDFGMTTEAGEALLQSMQWIVVPNLERQRAVEELRGIELTIESYKELWEKATRLGTPREMLLEKTRDWNELSDRAEDLAKELDGMPEYFRYIDPESFISGAIDASP